MMNKFTISLVASIGLASCSQPVSNNDASHTNTPRSEVEKSRNGAALDRYAPPTQAQLDRPTQVVMLGTGTPFTDAHRAGSSIAIVHKGEAYLFDVGAGATHNAVKARVKYDMPSLNPHGIKAVFLTHLHSDHIADLPSLSSTLWWERSARLKVYGPAGLNDLSKGAETFFAADTDLRLNGIQPIRDPELYKMDMQVIEPGIIFKGDDITIEAFAVPHGTIDPAFGYKIVTSDKSIVISGDTSKSKIIEEKAAGVDLLFHEVVSEEGLATVPPKWQTYHKDAHTLSTELADMAKIAKPKTVVLYHGLYFGVPENSVITEMKEHGYDGKVVLAEDLDKF